MRAKFKTITIASAFVIIVVTVTCVALGATSFTPGLYIRALAKFYLESTINPLNKDLWTACPATVTALLWDYRGLDTLYETTVLYLAVIGSVTVFRFSDAFLISYQRERKSREEGLSIIVKVVTRITFVLIVALSISIALQALFSPGGGFQGGSIFAVAPIIAIAAFSRRFLGDLRSSMNFYHNLRSVGLIIIALTALVPLMHMVATASGGFIMQNQPKPWALEPVFPGFPPYLGFLWLAGSIIIFTLGEYLNVAACFTTLLILLALPEDFYMRLMHK